MLSSAGLVASLVSKRSCSHTKMCVDCIASLSCTQVAPLIAGMQDRLRGLIAKSTEVSWYNRHVDLPSLRAEVLVAHGGFGSVFQGSWHGLDVAIKVSSDAMQLVRNAFRRSSTHMLMTV